MKEQRNFTLRCSGCGTEYAFGTYSCKNDDGILFAEYDLGSVKKFEDLVDSAAQGTWRFARVLPNLATRVTLLEGQTPCIQSRSFGPSLGIQLYIKDEGRNPSGSFKDRASAVLTSTELELGHTTCATASSGNAGGSLALYSIRAGMDLKIFMYHPTREKLLHAASFDPSIYLVETEVESDVMKLTAEACAKFGWSMLTTMSSANPYNVEGYKIIAYEIVETMGVPDSVVLPVGSGTLALGVWKGFCELRSMGLISRIPRIGGVQPERVAPIAAAYAEGEVAVKPVVPGKTVATGAVVDDPGIAGNAVLHAIRESGGWVVSVPEVAILDAWRRLPAEEGVFAEPTGALSVAGMMSAVEKGHIKRGETVVCVNSASGFKDSSRFETTENWGAKIRTVSPTIDLMDLEQM